MSSSVCIKLSEKDSPYGNMESILARKFYIVKYIELSSSQIPLHVKAFSLLNVIICGPMQTEADLYKVLFLPNIKR